MNADFEITIDGQTTGVQKGETILQVARRLGIDIPVFCWHPRIDPVGACRMCLVEVEKIPKLVVACATPAGPNMVVHTRNERVDKARKGVIEFLLVDHPLDCPTCDKGGECTLQDNVYHYGLDRSRFTETKHRWERDERYFLDDAHIGPQMIRNMNRCIRCYRCTRFTQEVAGEGDLGVFNRGWHTEIDTLPDREIGNLFSGNTVEICPVGALMSEDFRYTARPWLSYRTPSVCNLCADGCNLTLWSDRRQLFRCTSRANDEVDEGWICDRGRYAYAYRQSAERITEPRRRDGNRLVSIGWEEALEGASGALRQVLERHGAGAIGGLVSPTSANENMYLLQRFMRSVLGSNSIDWRVDRKVLDSPPRRRHHRAFPRRNRPLTMIDHTSLIVAFGCDLENERPISGLRALKAQRKHGARLILVNNRSTRLRRKADAEHVYAPHSERLIWSGLLKLIAGHKSEPSLPDPLRQALDAVQLDDVATASGLSREVLEQLARQMCEAPSCLVLLGRDIRQSAAVESIVDLALAAGEVLGLDGGDAGAVELTPEYSNSIGATLMGAEPEVLPGGKEGQDTRHAAHLADLWGRPLPDAGGFDAAEMLEAAHNDRLKALVLLDVDPLFHFPDTRWVEDALARLDCIITLGKFDTGLAGVTHYWLPTASVHEQAGTFISGEGRLQYFESAVRIAGGARPVREILSELAGRLGHTWEFTSAQSVFHEISQAIPALEGTSHAALRGTPGRLLDVEARPQDESLWTAAAEALQPPDPVAEAAPEGEFLLVTGNMGHHFGHLTHQSEPIMNFASVPYALLHPEDCETLRAESGHWLALSSDRGRIEVTARPSPLVARGMVVVPIHYPEANPNRLRDRRRAADYVRIERVENREPETLQPRVAIAEVGAWTW